MDTILVQSNALDDQVALLHGLSNLLTESSMHIRRIIASLSAMDGTTIQLLCLELHEKRQYLELLDDKVSRLSKALQTCLDLFQETEKQLSDKGNSSSSHFVSGLPLPSTPLPGFPTSPSSQWPPFVLTLPSLPERCHWTVLPVNTLPFKNLRLSQPPVLAVSPFVTMNGLSQYAEESIAFHLTSLMVPDWLEQLL